MIKMAKYRVIGALGGGFGGCENVEWEEVECISDDQAEQWAYDLAIEQYEMYEGNHGIRSTDDIMEEDEVCEREAEEMRQEEIESWVDYEYEKVE